MTRPPSPALNTSDGAAATPSIPCPMHHRARKPPEHPEHTEHTEYAEPIEELERGGISLVMASAMVLMVVLAYALLSGAAIAHARWRAGIAADHAALAGAHQALGLTSTPGEPCQAAQYIAQDNNAQLTECHWDGTVLRVSVHSVIGYGLFAGHTVRADARAGPAEMSALAYEVSPLSPRSRPP